MTIKEFLNNYAIKVVEYNGPQIVKFFKSLGVTTPMLGSGINGYLYGIKKTSNQLVCAILVSEFNNPDIKVISLEEAEILISMSEGKITKKDLIGDLKGFPIEVVERMLECQEEQKNQKNIKIFQNNIRAIDIFRGFTWASTKEGYDFWDNVLLKKRFDIFFSKHPKKQSNFGKSGIISKKENNIKLNKTFKYRQYDKN